MEVMAGVLGGRPVLALCFEDMEVTCCGCALKHLIVALGKLDTRAMQSSEKRL